MALRLRWRFQGEAATCNNHGITISLATRQIREDGTASSQRVEDNTIAAVDERCPWTWKPYKRWFSLIEQRQHSRPHFSDELKVTQELGT